jgi:hypothetical protein
LGVPRCEEYSPGERSERGMAEAGERAPRARSSVEPRSRGKPRLETSDVEFSANCLVAELRCHVREVLFC